MLRLEKLIIPKLWVGNYWFQWKTDNIGRTKFRRKYSLKFVPTKFIYHRIFFRRNYLISEIAPRNGERGHEMISTKDRQNRQEKISAKMLAVICSDGIHISLKFFPPKFIPRNYTFSQFVCISIFSRQRWRVIKSVKAWKR